MVQGKTLHQHAPPGIGESASRPAPIRPKPVRSLNQEKNIFMVVNGQWRGERGEGKGKRGEESTEYGVRSAENDIRGAEQRLSDIYDLGCSAAVLSNIYDVEAQGSGLV